jgi:hypothetical protein
MSVALMVVAPSMTWLFVSTSPDEVRTIPVPAACALSYPRVVLMSTRPGSTFEAMADRFDGLPEADEIDPPGPAVLDPDVPERPAPGVAVPDPNREPNVEPPAGVALTGVLDDGPRTR